MWPKISHLTTYVFCERKLSLIVVEFYYFIPIRIRGQQYCTPSLRQRHWLGMLLWRTLSDSDKFWCKCCWENVLLNDHLFAGCSPLLTEFSALPGETRTQEIASFQLNAVIVASPNTQTRCGCQHCSSATQFIVAWCAQHSSAELPTPFLLSYVPLAKSWTHDYITGFTESWISVKFVA